MARRKSVALTDGELRLMDVLWNKGHATVGEVVDALDGSRKPAYNTVLTLLRILEQKGHVTHDKAGRAFVYVPVIDRSQARQSALRLLLNRFFDDSPAALMLNLLEQDQITGDELLRLRARIEASQAR
jgi:predicted transcriptional regulator